MIVFFFLIICLKLKVDVCNICCGFFWVYFNEFVIDCWIKVFDVGFIVIL